LNREPALSLVGATSLSHNARDTGGDLYVRLDAKECEGPPGEMEERFGDAI